MNEPLKAPLHSPPPDLASYQKPNPPESRTPETDAEVDKHSTRPTGCVPSMFARSLELRLNEALAKLAEAAKDNKRLANRLTRTNSAWVNELGCYPLPYGAKKHIRDILQLNEEAINAAMKGDK